MGSFFIGVFFLLLLSPIIYAVVVIIGVFLKSTFVDITTIPDIYTSPKTTKITAASEAIKDKVKTVYYNNWVDRKVPPRPVFFCKLEGDSHVTTGDYEEKYLDTSSLYYWREKCKKENITNNIPTKSTYLTEKTPLLEQNCEKSVDFDKF